MTSGKIMTGVTIGDDLRLAVRGRSGFGRGLFNLFRSVF